MIETRAPGKLFVVGEYAVVEPGEPAILVAVDRYLTVRLTEQAESPERAERSDVEESTHVLAAIRAVDELRAERGLPEKRFSLEITSELEDADGRKYGLGSSAAVTTAVVGALDRLYDLNLDLLDRFKLALLATIDVSPRASGGDLAASTFRGWLRYSSPDRAALAGHRAMHGIGATLGGEVWEGFSVSRLPEPEGLDLCVGWTGSPASTEQLVDGVAPRTGRTGLSDSEHQHFLSQSLECVDAFAGSIGVAPESAQDAIRYARALLRGLGEAHGTTIETPLLRNLCDIAERHDAAAKPSGAGGGDCGIALAGTGSDITGMLREWEDHGIRHLDLSVVGSRLSAEGEADER